MAKTVHLCPGEFVQATNLGVPLTVESVGVAGAQSAEIPPKGPEAKTAKVHFTSSPGDAQRKCHQCLQDHPCHRSETRPPYSGALASGSAVHRHPGWQTSEVSFSSFSFKGEEDERVCKRKAHALVLYIPFGTMVRARSRSSAVALRFACAPLSFALCILDIVVYQPVQRIQRHAAVAQHHVVELDEVELVS